jgi:hypothetical protein
VTTPFSGMILAIDAMSDADCTFSTGVVSGGQWVNCVPTVCRGQVVRRGSGVARPAQSLQIEARDGIASGDDAVLGLTRLIAGDRPVHRR